MPKFNCPACRVVHDVDSDCPETRLVGADRNSPFKPEDLVPRLITTENPPPPGFVTVSEEEAAREMARFDTTPGPLYHLNACPGDCGQPFGCAPQNVTASEIRERTTGPLPFHRPRPSPDLADAMALMMHLSKPELREKTSAERKAEPIHSGVLMYFPDAVAAIARLSKAGNDKHNPGEPLHWARGKSMDQMDALVRHSLTRDKVDPETKELEAVAQAWRALAELQLLEEKRLVAAGIMPYSGITK